MQERGVADDDHARARLRVGIVGAALDRAQEGVELGIGLALRVGCKEQGDLGVEVDDAAASVAECIEGELRDAGVRQLSRQPDAPCGHLGSA